MTRTFPEFGYNPVTGEWNDSLKGDYCWSSVNYREAAPDVMTPSTWSLIWLYINVTDPNRYPGEHPAGGNICGRLYFNLSLGNMSLMRSILIISGLILSLVSLSFADVYQYTSEDGVVYYTDLPFGKNADLVIKDNIEPSPSQKKYERTNYKDTEYYQGIIHEKASKYNVDASLVKAVIKTESNWNERAVSRKGAVGPMQLMPSTANDERS